MRRIIIGASFAVLILVAGCQSATDHRSTDRRLPVFAGIPPLAYLVEQVGGEHVKVNVLVRPGQDPHTFEPTPRQVLALGNAAIFFKIDMPFEGVLLEKARESRRRLEIVDTTRGVKKRTMDALCCESSAGGHDHAAEGELDPHVWLSPANLEVMARNIEAALSRTDPAHQRDYRRNLSALAERLDRLDSRVRQMLAPYRGRSFYVFHPAFGYFADAYGLKQQAIESSGREPTSRELRTLIGKAKADGVTTVFIQPQFDPKSVQVVADAIGGQAVLVDDLATNVIADIEDIAAKIAKAMKESAGARTHAD